MQPIFTYLTNITLTISTLQVWVDKGSNIHVCSPFLGPGLSPHLYVGSVPVILPKLKGLGWLHSEHASRYVHASLSCSPAQGYAKINIVM